MTAELGADSNVGVVQEEYLVCSRLSNRKWFLLIFLELGTHLYSQHSETLKQETIKLKPSCDNVAT